MYIFRIAQHSNSKITYILLCARQKSHRHISLRNGFWRVVKNCMFWPYFVYRLSWKCAGALHTHWLFNRFVNKLFPAAYSVWFIYLYCTFSTGHSLPHKITQSIKPFLCGTTPDLREERKEEKNHHNKLFNVWTLANSSHSASITIHHHFSCSPLKSKLHTHSIRILQNVSVLLHIKCELWWWKWMWMCVCLRVWIGLF